MAILAEMIGKKIDDYKIIGIVGRGGMGVVYKAEDTALERVVALKVMDERFTSDPALLERFRSEAKALAKLDTSNIVKVYALRETELGFCLVMEFVDGQTLQERIRRSGALPGNEIAGIFEQVLMGLAHAHRANVIHRDLKPSNIMISSLGTAKITDFGLAKIQRPADSSKTVGVGGTPCYMSPEQIIGLGNVDVRGDIYSLGMTLYEAAAGRLPFSATDSDYTIQLMISGGKVPPVTKMNPAVPKDLARLITRAIETNPAKRFQSADEMLKALQQVPLESEADLERTVLLKQPPSRPAVAKPRKRWEKVAIPVLALVATILVASYLVFRPVPSLSVHTEPPGASVLINGSPVGKTPLEKVEVEEGNVNLQIRREGYRNRDTVLIVAGSADLQLFVPLQRIPESEPVLTIRTSPEGARVYLDNRYLGETPLPRLKIPLGQQTMRIEKQAYATRDTVLHVEGGEELDLTFVLARATEVGTVSITAVPEDAVVRIDGEVLNKRRLRQLDLSVGKHSVSVYHKDYREGVYELVVQPGQNPRAHYSLTPLGRFGNLTVAAGPGEVEVLIDDVSVGKTPFHRKVQQGNHRIRLVHPTYGLWERGVAIEPNVQKSVTVDFQKTYKAKILCFDEAGNSIRNGEIFVDGQALNNPITPFEIEARAGLRTIEVKRRSYKSEVIQRNIDDESELTIRFTLRKSQ